MSAVWIYNSADICCCGGKYSGGLSLAADLSVQAGWVCVLWEANASKQPPGIQVQHRKNDSISCSVAKSSKRFTVTLTVY